MIDGCDLWVCCVIWLGVDIFILLVDNIQEIFGIVLIEVMVVGLFVVMFDWDGFWDMVVDGEIGFLVFICMVCFGVGGFIVCCFVDGIDGYLYYLSLIFQSVQIDQDVYLEILDRLVIDYDLC